MPKPGEYKTVQARILTYAQQIGWTFVTRSEAETRRGFDVDVTTSAAQAARASLYFNDLLYEKVRAFNPKYTKARGDLSGRLRHLQANIFGNREFLGYLRNSGKFYCSEESRELDLRLINYDKDPLITMFLKLPRNDKGQVLFDWC
jgi:type I restriction enzyme R subunit